MGQRRVEIIAFREGLHSDYSIEGTVESDEIVNFFRFRWVLARDRRHFCMPGADKIPDCLSDRIARPGRSVAVFPA